MATWVTTDTDPPTMETTITLCDGVQVKVIAVDTANGIRFTLDVVEGFADLRGFFFDNVEAGALALVPNSVDYGDSLTTDSGKFATTTTLSDAGNLSSVGGSDNNMNGTGETFDSGLVFGSSGIGKDDISFVSFEIESASGDFNFDDLFGLSFGIRATSVGATADDREDSCKFVDEFPPELPPEGPPPAELCFDGLSQGAYKTPFNGDGDWTKTAFETTDTYESATGVDFHNDGATAITLLGILEASPGGDQEIILGKQVVAALLNATNTGETEMTASYRFSEAEIKLALQEVYTGGDGFNETQAADLANLLEFWNIAPENNTGEGAEHPGELCEDDTTQIALTLTYDKDGNPDTTNDILQGGSFEGSIIEVLQNLHPDHGWG